MTKEIKITCKAADGLALDELYEFQGELKTISDDELEKLKKSIKRWQDFTGKDAVLESNSKNFNTVSSSLGLVT
jgi:hypothetical protein